MADDSKDKSEKDDISTALGAASKINASWSAALNTNITSGVSQGVASLISGIVGIYRQEEAGCDHHQDSNASHSK